MIEIIKKAIYIVSPLYLSPGLIDTNLSKRKTIYQSNTFDR